MQGRYGLEATHPQYPQIIRLSGEVAAKSSGQDGQAYLNKPNKLMPGEEQHRQVQASPNKFTPGKVERRRVHQPNNRMPGEVQQRQTQTGEHQAKRRQR